MFSTDLSSALSGQRHPGVQMSAFVEKPGAVGDTSSQTYCLIAASCQRSPLAGGHVGSRDFISFFVLGKTCSICKKYSTLLEVSQHLFIFCSHRRGSAHSPAAPEKWARTRPWRRRCLLLLASASPGSPSSWCARPWNQSGPAPRPPPPKSNPCSAQISRHLNSYINAAKSWRFIRSEFRVVAQVINWMFTHTHTHGNTGILSLIPWDCKTRFQCLRYFCVSDGWISRSSEALFVVFSSAA